jgi:DNA polymerase-3 subunit gamma/tau
MADMYSAPGFGAGSGRQHQDRLMDDVTASGDSAAYRVLARKYRPGSFAALIGQEAMVRTLTNAFRQGRLAHAFILTGVRGVGKTTTARIIAKALNCIGPDGNGGPTIEPCGQCPHCIAIAADRDVDVIEMDAASRNGIDEIRELIDGVRYRPVAARFKVYILDEVHMLTKQAFNALLKTLEEPPEHVKFVFATTEIRKVPVTVLSRCQRFDLRRVEHAELARHLGAVAEAEGATVPPEALALLARAADGSVRDGLSLLDQAIAHGAGAPSAEQVRDMLGLADRAQILDLFDLLMKGEIRAGLALLAELYRSGADPVVVLQDLLETCQWLTRLKIDAEAEGALASDAERARGRAIAGQLAMPVLTRAWQMLLKGLAETQAAPLPLAAAEMALIRLAYAADLPSPADLVRQLRADPARPAPAPAPATRVRGDDEPRPTAAAPPRSLSQAAPSGGGRQAARAPAPSEEVAPAAAPEALRREPTPISPASAPLPSPGTFAALATLVAEREPILGAHLHNSVHLVYFETGRIELRTTADAPTDLAPRLGTLLHNWTGQRWVISLSNAPGEPTLGDAAKRAKADRLSRAAADPLVQAVLKSFPGAVVEDVRDIAATIMDDPEAPLDPDSPSDMPLAGDAPEGDLER